MREKTNVHRVWSSNELFGNPITALATWTTARFHRDNPKEIVAFIAAIREAIEFIRKDKAAAAAVYAKAEPSKLLPEYFANLLEDPGVCFTLAPENSIKIADYLTRIGIL
jgi:NitT/TauT family transport system substrate-binding protein